MDAQEIYAAILAAAEHQLGTSPAARAIAAAGLTTELSAIIQQIAANAANPIADMLEDALARG